MNNSSPQEVWSAVVSELHPEIGEDNVSLWLKPVEPQRIEGNLLHIRVPNKFFIDWIRDNYQRKIESCLKKLLGQDLSLSYAVAKDVQPLLPPSDPIPVALPQSEFTFSELNPRYTFNNFIVGTSNRFANATAEAICKNPGKQFNPFFLYGGVGLGKTHLMHAIGQGIRKKNSRARVLYITAEQFVNEYIDSIRYEKPDAFRSKYRNLDCLLIDDIQFLIAKGRSEEEFFHTYNALFDSHKQIIISSDRAPKEMSLEQRLVSRLEWGVVADIKPPDLETRIAILRKKAESEQILVPDDVILFVATAIKTNIRELEGALVRLQALAAVTGVHLTVDVAKETLKDTISADSHSPVRLETIQKLIAEKYSLDIRELKSKSRTSNVAFPRQVAMYLACHLTELSTTAIGQAFGGRDHSTVTHARDKIADLLEKDFLFVEQISKLTDQIKAVDNS
ncbi:MAG: chromosomal replication initiator protein DnaA [Elusimicrobia bacterium]|nr:chromosomal replication initiator protein DnaA [Elusimicrobiota bacterium]